MKYKVLIGCNGGLSGVYLAKRLRKLMNFEVYGADCAIDSVGKFFVDKQFVLPMATDKMFVKELINLLKEESIDIYFPTYSKEIRAVAANAKEIRSKTKTRFIVSPIETFNCLENKEDLYFSLKKNGVPTPELIVVEPTKYPIVMKQKLGSGSANFLRVENSQIYQAFRNTDNNKAFFEIIDGKEYTVDCVFDKEGKLLAYNQRERVKTIGGAVIISKNSADFEVFPWLEKLAGCWKFCGCVNFQYIVREDIPYFIDINLRFPSGGLPLTVESGIDVPAILINMLLGTDIFVPKFKSDGKKRTMYRYFEEYFEE